MEALVREWVRGMRINNNSLLLVMVVACFVAATAGCGGSSIEGVYKLYTPPWGSISGSVYELVPNLQLELKSNGMYEHTTYIIIDLPETQGSAPGMEFEKKSYKGTYTVRKDDNGQPTQIILNGEPADSNTYHVEKLGLVNPLGLWAKEPPPGTK